MQIDNSKKYFAYPFARLLQSEQKKEKKYFYVYNNK